MNTKRDIQGTTHAQLLKEALHNMEVSQYSRRPKIRLRQLPFFLFSGMSSARHNVFTLKALILSSFCNLICAMGSKTKLVIIYTLLASMFKRKYYNFTTWGRATERVKDSIGNIT